MGKTEMDAVIQALKLTKEFPVHFTFRKIKALSELSLEINHGEVFGLIGPNGAGKTTTFKLFLGLLFPTRGVVFLWGKPPNKIEVRARIGFLPESPYFYNYLKAKEYLQLCNQLFENKDKNKVDALLELVGLQNHKEALIKTYSKGMLQRLGLAQALINNPDLLILDEPMSGLDPSGRKEIRDLILELKNQGKTIIFSSHILSDVETICDRVGIIINGKLQACGNLDELLQPRIKSWEICLKGLLPETINQLKEQGLFLLQRGEETILQVKESEINKLLLELLAKGGKLISVIPRKETLEELYVKKIKVTEKQV